MDGSRPCIYISVKWILLIALAVDLINSIVAIPSGISAIDDQDKEKDQPTEKPPDADNDSKKVIVIIERFAKLLSTTITRLF